MLHLSLVISKNIPTQDKGMNKWEKILPIMMISRLLNCSQRTAQTQQSLPSFKNIFQSYHEIKHISKKAAKVS